MKTTNIPLKRINRDFSIKYFPDKEKKGTYKFIGASQFYKMLGETLASKKINIVYKRGEDTVDISLPRGIKFQFVSR